MRQSKRLDPIHAHKKRQEDEAAKRLAKISQEVGLKKKNLSELESYRGEYDQQFLETSRAGVSAKRLKDYQAFMVNLSKVLDHQRTAISTLEIEYEEKKRQWLAAKNKTNALGRVQQGYQKQEALLDEKKQQKEQDDRSSRSAK